MSNAVFPLLPGLSWGASKTPQFNTKVMRAVSGRELRASLQAEPIYEIKLSFEFLRQRSQTELDQLEAFFIARKGSYDSFLLAMPDDSTLRYVVTGNGTDDTWQIQRFGLPLLHVEPSTALFDASMYTSDDTDNMWSPTDVAMWLSGVVVSAAGVITASSPPRDGQTLYTTVTYYYRCRFAEDKQEYVNFMQNLWSASRINIIGSLGNKI